ncbi:MAG: hypothetical protein HQ567_01190 [Candidatus Nealsonbacteria bacterium]|nr:hypothetical protein [Candidatus Nealsonbacteria bacterium]
MRRFVLLAVVVFCCVGEAWADSLVVFNSRSDFLSQTGAVAVTNISTTGYSFFDVGAGFTNGDLSFDLVNGQSTRFIISDWTERLAGNDLAISGLESADINIGLSVGPMHSFGFDFVEPQFDKNVAAAFVESTFSVTLMNDTTIVGSFTFERPNDSAQFVGVWATDPSEAFDRVEIRETVGGIENEFFGEFYAGTATEPVPAPTTVVSLIGLGIMLSLTWARRRSRARS